MAVAYISDVDKQDVPSGNDTFTSFAVSGVNPVIIISVSLDAAATVSSIVLSAGLTGGTPVKVKSQVNGTTNTEIWGIPAPSGTGTITVSYSASVPHQCNASLFQGADQTTPCPATDAVSATGSTTPLTVTPTNLTANDAVVYMGSQTNAGDAPHAATGTEIMFGNATNCNAAVGYSLGTGSVSVTWSITATTEVVVAVRIQAASAGGSTFVPLIGGPGGVAGMPLAGVGGGLVG